MAPKKKQHPPSIKKIPEGSKIEASDRTLAVETTLVAFQAVSSGVTSVGRLVCQIGTPVVWDGRELRATISELSVDDLPGGAFIDQHSGWIPEGLFRKLVEKEAFPFKRFGHSIVAQWEDVRRVVATDQNTQLQTQGEPVELPDPEAEALDKLRADLSIVRK